MPWCPLKWSTALELGLDRAPRSAKVGHACMQGINYGIAYDRISGRWALLQQLLRVDNDMLTRLSKLCFHSRIGKHGSPKGAGDGRGKEKA